MYKDFQLPCLLSGLKPLNSFSPNGQEPFCLNPLHPFLQWCIWCQHKEVGKPLCLAFQAGEDQLSTVHIKSERTMKILLQVYQHLHTPKPVGQASSACCVTNQHLTLGNETTQDQLEGASDTPETSLPVQGSGSAGNQMVAWHEISSLGIWKCISSLCPDLTP